MVLSETEVNEKQNIQTVSASCIENFKINPMLEQEIADEFFITKNKYLFFKQKQYVSLLKTFNERMQMEKYLLRTAEGRIIAGMDLKIYKDSVYIVHLETNSSYAPCILKEFIHAAVKTAKNSAGAKDVIISIPLKYKYRNILKKILLKNDFLPEEEQGNCEKKLFGETYKLDSERLLRIKI